ncbi:hypothetical protein PILCRDRAFT_15506 [Piloderma croceum F 1598]|uniref:Uncharacterized protein n=1 Tax=Piloderma croceum (strain F 1598) TaxID=765440 RepID=A0A0C3EYX5_PILCF|nr:hypothetical protein PILCRDRAFT_15506 [Piloderma croceum F 1598]
MAVCLLDIGGADNVAETSKLSEKVPELRHKIAGKFIPVEGLNWIVSLDHNGLNGILADEMGLALPFLAYPKHHLGIAGPHLIVVPKKNAPELGVRVQIKNSELQHRPPHRNKRRAQGALRTDSSRKISKSALQTTRSASSKNLRSKNSVSIHSLISPGRLLITGTPLQNINSLKELFARLNFICPEILWTMRIWIVFLHKVETDSEVETERSKKVIEALHKILRPFLLRKVKTNVEKNLLPKKEINIYVRLAEMQWTWHRSVLEKDIDAVMEGKTRLMNMVMQLCKVACHPYYFDGAEPCSPYATDEHLIENSGRMVILDKLLASRKEKGLRVNTLQIDSGTAHDDRTAGIDEYNKPGSEKFIFLLTTRAGGLGINLTTADIVVLYDSECRNFSW